VSKASVANPEVADVVVIGERDIVINALKPGETDVILWEIGAPRKHYRISVHSSADRKQIIIAVRFAEVRRDLLRTIGLSGLYRDADVRAGSGVFRNDNAINGTTGAVTLPAASGYGTVLSDFGTTKFLALLDAEEQKGDARILAQPNLMAANNEEASFLAGGELPIPVAQAAGTGGTPLVTILWREFGIRLTFTGEIISDSLIKLKIKPEVSSLDYGNAITLEGFQIPALRTRRVESTVDVRRDQSLILSGLLDDERQKVRTGVPFLSSIPILGTLFSSTRWQNSETELVVVVTPVVIDPLSPRPQDVLHFAPDSATPAAAVLEQHRVRTAPDSASRSPR
jgi:pilus assembly protein CpaC